MNEMIPNPNASRKSINSAIRRVFILRSDDFMNDSKVSNLLQINIDMNLD